MLGVLPGDLVEALTEQNCRRTQLPGGKRHVSEQQTLRCRPAPVVRADRVQPEAALYRMRDQRLDLTP